jgi:SAM-dependent methyltransferase
VTTDGPDNQAEHTLQTREAYDRLAAVWSSTTDEGPFNGLLERPAIRELVPGDLHGATVLDAGCGSGAQAEWLLDQGADVVAIDVSPRMVEEAERRCGGRGRFLVADLAWPLPFEPRSLDGITCSLALHYVADWSVPLQSFASALRPGGWAVISLDHPFGPRTPQQRGSYFDTELVSDTWRKADVEVTQQFWRRPLAAVLGSFADAGFTVDRVAEPQPSAEALRQSRTISGPWPQYRCSSFTGCGFRPRSACPIAWRGVQSGTLAMTAVLSVLPRPAPRSGRSATRTW